MKPVDVHWSSRVSDIVEPVLMSEMSFDAGVPDLKVTQAVGKNKKQYPPRDTWRFDDFLHDIKHNERRSSATSAQRFLSFAGRSADETHGICLRFYN